MKITDTLLAVFTFFLVVFTALLAVYTRKLWNATVSIVKGAEDTAKRQLRAYVCISAATINLDRKDAPEAHVVIKNCGQTPAHDVRCWIHMWIAAHPLAEVLPIPPADFPTAVSVLAPGGHTISVINKEPPVSPDVVHLLGTSEGTIYVYGEVRYKDVFGIERYTKYRLMYGGSEGLHGHNLKPDREGNEAT